MTLDFDDLPELTEYCDCYRGVRYTKDGEVPCTDCVEGNRPTKFGKAVLDLIAKHGKIDEKIAASHRPCACERIFGGTP